jgi:hypothetical protein
MFATFLLEDARRQLNGAVYGRLWQQWVAERGITFNSMSFPFERVRFPVGLFFIRGDRAGPGKTLAEQVVASFGYWNDDSGKYFDMVFPGWGKDGDAIVFDRTAFLSFRSEIEKICKYRYSGQTDILLLNYDYTLKKATGDFSFDEAILLPVEDMVRDGRVSNLDTLMHELIGDAKEMWQRTDRSVIWDISDKIALDKGRQALWKLIKEKFLKELGKVYDELRPFAICDLRLSL